MADFIEIIEPGPLSTIQDRGRFGYQRFGISASGAMDQTSFRIANALLGNDGDAAVIEMTLAGMTLKIGRSPARLAYAGADTAITVDGRPVGACRGFRAEPGQVVAIGPMSRGLRGYLAIGGGVACPPVQGSRSTHTRSAIGGLDGGPLRQGQLLPLANNAENGPLLILADTAILATDGPVRVLLGPQDAMFSQSGIETFLSSDYRLSSKVDRMGCQLEGPPIAHLGDFNIVSDGIANGSIQVPGNGQPIILLADRQTTGGYAKIATVISHDLRKIAQARPGNALRFTAVGAQEAEHIARTEASRLSSCLATIAASPAPARSLAPDQWWTLDLLGGVVAPPQTDAAR